MHPAHPYHIWVRQLGCRALAEVGYSLATESSVWNKTIPGPMEELGLETRLPMEETGLGLRLYSSVQKWWWVA